MRLTSSALALLIVGCASSSKPPDIDESTRRPVNAPGSIEMQACKSELRNTRIQLNEATRAADIAIATGQRLTLLRQDPGNAIHVIPFAMNSSQVRQAVPDLIEQARSAALVVVRGTLTAAPSGGQAQLDRARLAAVRTHLVKAGIDPSRIRTVTMDPADAREIAASGASRSERAVEVELYRIAPRVATDKATVATTGPHQELP